LIFSVYGDEVERFSNMKFKAPFFSVAAIVLGCAACQKNADKAEGSGATKSIAIDVVKESERSRSFAAVNRQLELGGTLYGYVDIDGDVLKLAGDLQEALQQVTKLQPTAVPFLPKDFRALATTLGLGDVKAVGVSSVPDGTGYFRNRAFFYTGDGARHGILAGLGGPPHKFTHLNLAPADTAFYAENEVDFGAIYKTVKEVVTQIAGEPASSQLETTLKKSGEAVALSVLDLIYGLKGNSAVVLRIDPEKTLRLPGATPMIVPAFALVVCVDNIAPIVEPALAKSPLFRRTDDGARHVYAVVEPSQIPGVEPVIVLDGSTLYFTTSQAFLAECQARTTGLAQVPEFQRALAEVGPEGNGLTYMSPRLFAQARRISELNPKMSEESQAMFRFVLSRLPAADQPLVAVRTNLPDGILMRSRLNRSLKQDVAMIGVYNPVTIGLVAAMAIPAFQKVRMASQEKAVLNNLRQLAAAADQFYLENGARAASFNDLVGPNRYIRTVVSVMGEDYRPLRFAQGQPLVLRLPDGRVLRFPEGAAPGPVNRTPLPQTR
jgi:type IV pilus assembly protein PilA